MNIIVMTSDKYLNALPPFAHLFNKYWQSGDTVNVVGFKQPDFNLPANFRFNSLGSMDNYPVNRWSNALIESLQPYKGDHVIIMLEDYWITRPVNIAAVNYLWDYAKQFQYVLKIDLCADRLYAGGMTNYGQCGYLDLVKSDPTSQYHMSLMTGIWNVDLLLEKVLIPDETPWQVELEGTSRLALAGDDVLVLGTRQWPVLHTLAHRRGNPSELFLDEISEADVNWMKAKEWI